MIILVTGGTGLVGKAIQNIKHDYDDIFIFLSSKDCDLSNYTDTFNTLPEVIVPVVGTLD